MVRGIIDGRFGGRAGRRRGPVAQVSKPVVSPISKSARRGIYRRVRRARHPVDAASRRHERNFPVVKRSKTTGSRPVRALLPRRGGRSLRSQFFRRVRAIHTKASVALSSVRNEDEGRGEEALRDAGPLGISEALLYPPAPAGRGEWSRSTNRSSGMGGGLGGLPRQRRDQ